MQYREVHPHTYSKDESHDSCPHQYRRINAVDAPLVPVEEIATSAQEQGKTTAKEEQHITYCPPVESFTKDSG